jgi:hypothetical protein
MFRRTTSAEHVLADSRGVSTPASFPDRASAVGPSRAETASSRKRMQFDAPPCSLRVPTDALRRLEVLGFRAHRRPSAINSLRLKPPRVLPARKAGSAPPTRRPPGARPRSCPASPRARTPRAFVRRRCRAASGSRLLRIAPRSRAGDAVRGGCGRPRPRAPPAPGEVSGMGSTTFMGESYASPQPRATILSASSRSTPAATICSSTSTQTPTPGTQRHHGWPKQSPRSVPREHVCH